MQATNTGVRRPGYEATPSVPSQPHLPVLFIATSAPRYLTLVTVLDLFIVTSAPRYLTLVTVLEYSSRQVDQRLHDNNICDVIIVHVTSPDAQTNQNTKQF